MRNETKPPPRLSPEAKRWWSEIMDGWKLDPAALVILTTAAEAYDMELTALRDIRDRGQLVKGKANPSIRIAKDAGLMKLRALRALNLDLEPLNNTSGRPAGTFNVGKRR